MEIEKLNTVAEYLDALDQIDHLWESDGYSGTIRPPIPVASGH